MAKKKQSQSPNPNLNQNQNPKLPENVQNELAKLAAFQKSLSQNIGVLQQ